MILVLALTIALLFGASMYMMLHRSFFKLITGIFLFGYSTIFFLFALGGLNQGSPAILGETAPTSTAGIADPLPQALTLTAIVISLGVQLFVIVLLKRLYQEADTENLDDLNKTDSIG